MKRLLLVVLAIVLAAPAFAGDALVLPGGVGRVYVVPVYGFEGGTWEGSDYQKVEDNDFTLEELLNLGGAIEYGITDQISIGIQWAPGINLTAPLNSEDNTDVFGATDPAGPPPDFDTQGYDDEPLALAVDGSAFATGAGSTFLETPTKEDVTAEGVAPVAVGAEIQLIGPQGFVQQDSLVRFSVTPGIEAAFPEPDWKAQGEAFLDGDPYVDPRVYAAGLSPRWAVGGQVDFDVVPTDSFYLNLGFEYKHRFARTFDATDFYKEAGVFLTEGNPLNSENLSGGDVKSVEYEAGRFHEVSIDLEPDYRLPLNAPLRINVSLPTTLAVSSGSEVDLKYELDTTNHGAQDVKVQDVSTSDTSYLLTMGPSVSIFFTELPLPVQLVGYWNFPITGQNAAQRQTGVLEARVYFSTN